MRRIALLTALLVLVAAPAAQAGWKIERATAIARVVWHNPCVDRMTIRWIDFTQLADKRTREAKAFATPEDCTAYLNSAETATWGDLCYELMHEAGHLAGYRDPVGIEPLNGGPMDYDHSSDPKSIMYPMPATLDNDGHISDDANWRCRDRGRPYLRGHGLL